ncbi:MAG: ThuA domain-containing protein, partial [Verrucomicrobia bacterium]|nr:ThuA domain-containing protein [Verrucomicrobiota bacterium]
VLLVGGGSSHDFKKFFNETDSATLKSAGFSVNYTEDGDVTARELSNADVAVLSVNAKEWATPALRRALFDFAEQGRGLVLLHPGVWYNYPDWPEYNRVLAGGGSRGHDRPLEFEVKVTNAAHPLMKGLPASFKITDELYWFELDAQGTPVEALAKTFSPQKQREYPMVWIVKHPKTRIAGIALGHDARAHDLPEFQTLLKNAVNWAAGK